MREIINAVDELGTCFEEFKRSNDQRLKKLEKGGSVDTLIVEKTQRLDSRMNELESYLNRLYAQKNRTGFSADSENEIDQHYYKDSSYASDHKAMFHKWLRYGDTGTLKELEQKALSVGSDPEGGYSVTSDISRRISQIIFESSPMRELASIETTSGSSIEMLIDDDESEAEWVSETQERPETKAPHIGKIEIVVNEMYANPFATQKMLDDASFDVDQWLANKVGEKFARKEATAFIHGDGIEQPRGLLTFPHGTGRGKIQQVASGASNSIQGDALIKLVAELKVPYLRNATFLMNRQTQSLIRQLKSTSGEYYLWQPSFQAGNPNSLLGYPVRLAEDMPDADASELAIVFGDIGTAYTVVDRIGIRVLRDPYTNKPYVSFYVTKRVGGTVTTWEAVKIMKIGESI